MADSFHPRLYRRTNFAVTPTYPTLVASMGAFEGQHDPMRFEWQLHPPLQVFNESFSYQVPAEDIFLRYERSPFWLLTYFLLITVFVFIAERFFCRLTTGCR